MKNRFLTALIIISGLAGGCAEEPQPPPSVPELMQNKILLDATMVRCSRDRAEMKYAAECVNAREASNLLAREAEAERRNLLEQQSERKRAALRRAQEAADQARWRAEEAARRRAEVDYLSQFGTEPGAVLDRPASADSGTGEIETEPAAAATSPTPGVENTPTIENMPAEDAAIDAAAGDLPEEAPSAEQPAANDLQSIRDELERRKQAAEPR